MIVDEVTEKLQKHNAFIKSAYHTTDIGLFGSCIKGNMKKRSDIDILVSFENGCKDFFNYMRLKLYLEELLGRRVDLVIKEALKPRLRDKILGEVRYVQ